jgi:hypothetical protein
MFDTISSPQVSRKPPLDTPRRREGSTSFILTAIETLRRGYPFGWNVDVVGGVEPISTVVSLVWEFILRLRLYSERSAS